MNPVHTSTSFEIYLNIHPPIYTCLRNGLFPWQSRLQLCTHLAPCHACYMFRPSHLPWFHRPRNNLQREVIFICKTRKRNSKAQLPCCRTPSCGGQRSVPITPRGLQERWQLQRLLRVCVRDTHQIRLSRGPELQWCEFYSVWMCEI
jgi:hypothetical protein